VFGRDSVSQRNMYEEKLVLFLRKNSFRLVGILLFLERNCFENPYQTHPKYNLLKYLDQ